jgi:TPR repeat protein
LLSSVGERSAAGQDYAALAARLTEIEKRTASSSFDVDAIKSTESELARRVYRLEAALSRLQELPPAPALNSPAPPTPPAATPHLSNERPPARVPPTASLQLPSEEIAELLARGDTLLRGGDIASARLFYERAANAGNGPAALLLGATFDPVFLGRDAVRRVLADPAEAHLWYQRARNLGEAEAERRLKNLETK